MVLKHTILKNIYIYFTVPSSLWCFNIDNKIIKKLKNLIYKYLKWIRYLKHINEDNYYEYKLDGLLLFFWLSLIKYVK